MQQLRDIIKKSKPSNYRKNGEESQVIIESHKWSKCREQLTMGAQPQMIHLTTDCLHLRLRG